MATPLYVSYSQADETNQTEKLTISWLQAGRGTIGRLTVFADSRNDILEFVDVVDDDINEEEFNFLMKAERNDLGGVEPDLNWPNCLLGEYYKLVVDDHLFKSCMEAAQLLLTK